MKTLHTLERLPAGALTGALRGIEKESLRVTADGRLAATPHPAALGAALTHPWITTDFSEAMVELITPPLPTNGESLAFLADLHGFVARHIDGELLWAASMPCFLEGEVPLARFGRSNSGRMREVYRAGLSHRYGRAMEIISGVHFNFSPPESFWAALHPDGASERELRDAAFFGLLRNYRRWGWLIHYLFGASPAVCHTFFHGRTTTLPELLPGTFHGPFTTSLRMSDIGYRSQRQAGLAPSMNTLQSYVETLARAVQTPEPEYQKIGVEVDGEWRQLSANLLQIENEYYGFIRPKQPMAFGERPLYALRDRGVAYVEVRALDVDPFSPLGVSAETLDFMEAFLWLCLLSDSPPMGADDLVRCDAHHAAVALEGRRPGLVLAGGASFEGWARELLERMTPICEILDGASGGTHSAALSTQRAKLGAPETTPSARLIELIRARGTSFFQVALELSQAHREELLARPLSGERTARLSEDAERSREDQRELEASQTGSFAEYVRGYLEEV